MTPEKGYIQTLLDAVAGRDADRYHTPGHKGTLCARDVTELGADSRIFPADCIEKAQAHTAELYGVRHVRYLIGGSSMGIKAGLSLFRGKKVLYAAGAHRAFFEGCELFGVQAVPVGETDGDAVYTCGCEVLPPPITLSDAARALDTHRDAAALFVTSPDCLGRTSDKKIADLCRARGVRLLADGAHGAHFAFAPALESYRMETTADVCNMSAHKTLGAFTQTALLAVNRDEDLPLIDHALRLLGTTSPNYVLLDRLERSVLAAKAHTGEYGRLRAFAARLRAAVPLLENTDYTRLCVVPQNGNAAALYEYAAAHGIYAEAILNGCVVFITTPYDDADKCERLFKLLTEGNV